MKIIISILVLIGLAGCASMPRVTESPLDRGPITSKIEAQDVRRVVDKMVQSLLTAGSVEVVVGNRRPVLDIEPMKNRTSQHIDMVSITDSIRSQLLRSGKFRFVDKSTMLNDLDTIDMQNQLGLVDSKKAVKAGKQSAAQMYLTGSLTEIKNKVGRTIDQYYKFSMILKDLESGELIWADEKEIRKASVKPRFGM